MIIICQVSILIVMDVLLEVELKIHTTGTGVSILIVMDVLLEASIPTLIQRKDVSILIVMDVLLEGKKLLLKSVSLFQSLL